MDKRSDIIEQQLGRMVKLNKAEFNMIIDKLHRQIPGETIELLASIYEKCNKDT